MATRPRSNSKAKGPALPQRGTNLTVAFGLVSVPVKIKPLIEPRKPVSANYICPEHQEKVQMKKWCASGDHEVTDAAKGYPVNGGFVQLSDDDVEQLVADKDSQLTLEKVVDVAAIDPGYYSRSYLVYPGEGDGRAFGLLAAALRETKQAAVGTTVLAKAKQTQMVVLRYSDAFDSLVAHVCHFDSEVRWADVELVQAAAAGQSEPSKQEASMATTLLNSLAGEFDAAEVEDVYFPALQQLIDAAEAGNPAAPAKKAAEPEVPVADLMAALEASVKGAQAKKPARTKAA